jgi:hypothetical protein
MFYFSLLSGFVNRFPKIAPVKAPYKVLLSGLEVMAQLPDEQPTKYQ